MSQDEILNLLDKKTEMTMEEIAERLQISLVAVWTNLKGLLKELEVQKRLLTKEEVENIGKRFTGRNVIWFIPKDN